MLLCFSQNKHFLYDCRNCIVSTAEFLFLFLLQSVATLEEHFFPSSSMSNRVVHFEIQATDPERAAKFYREVFGWQIDKW